MPGQPESWQIVFFKRHPDDDSTESRPGRAFLASCPIEVARTIGNILVAVRDSPPPSFAGGGMWEAMHSEMRGYYEVRVTGPGRRQYRLFCILEHQRPGLANKSIVVIDGMWKPHRTVFSDADYADVRRLGDEYRARTPRSVQP